MHGSWEVSASQPTEDLNTTSPKRYIKLTWSPCKWVSGVEWGKAAKYKDSWDLCHAARAVGSVSPSVVMTGLKEPPSFPPREGISLQSFCSPNQLQLYCGTPWRHVCQYDKAMHSWLRDSRVSAVVICITASNWIATSLLAYDNWFKLKFTHMISCLYFDEGRGQ